MIKIKSAITNSKLVNPISLSKDGYCPANFAYVYKYLVDQGLMDGSSYALSTVSGQDYQRIYSISSSDHKESFEKGMMRVKISDDEHTYFAGVADRFYEREYKQANMLMKMDDVTSVFKFKCKLKLKKPTIKIDSNFNVTNIGGTSPIMTTPKLQLRNLFRIPDNKEMWLGYLENGYAIIGFSDEWPVETVIRVIENHYRFKKKRIKEAID